MQSIICCHCQSYPNWQILSDQPSSEPRRNDSLPELIARKPSSTLWGWLKSELAPKAGYWGVLRSIKLVASWETTEDCSGVLSWWLAGSAVLLLASYPDSAHAHERPAISPSFLTITFSRRKKYIFLFNECWGQVKLANNSRLILGVVGQTE